MKKNRFLYHDYKFPVGEINFTFAIFGEGVVNFSGASFREGEVNFSCASFGEGDFYFSNVTFEEGMLHFSNTTFGKGNLYFSDTTFRGYVDFSFAVFGEGAVSFENSIFNGNTFFPGLRSCDKCKIFTFRNVGFNNSFNISGDFGCVVNMVGTKTSHHVELSGLNCTLQRKRSWWLFKKALDKEDAARLRRLKELAEQNKHHEAALRFHADEMRAKRWIETGVLGSWMDMVFSVVCDYGQTALRPALFLMLLTLVSFWLPHVFSHPTEFLILPVKDEAIQLAIKNSLSFLPAARPTAESGFLSILHQLVAIILIFLIGLGLRNRFRI